MGGGHFILPGLILTKYIRFYVLLPVRESNRKGHDLRAAKQVVRQAPIVKDLCVQLIEDLTEATFSVLPSMALV